VTGAAPVVCCDLDGVHGLDAYLAVIAAYAASHPDEPWIRGDGWSMPDFPMGVDSTRLRRRLR